MAMLKPLGRSLLDTSSVQRRVRLHASSKIAFPRQYTTSSDKSLFEYTSGRWLYNEKLRLQERYIPFNLFELKKAAAKSIERSIDDISSITKFSEGRHNRMLEISFKDGRSILARLPYPVNIPRRLIVASEVATLDFLHAHDLPVPKVFAYDINENAVGTEYMLIEKMAGEPIGGDRWYQLTKKEKFTIVYDFVQLEKKMFSIDLPASGSLYYVRDLGEGMEMVDVPDFDGLCVGPYASYSWWEGKRSDMDIDHGPHTDPLRVLQSPAEKEIAWSRAFAHPRQPFIRPYREALNHMKQEPSAYIKALENYLDLTPHLTPNTPDMNKPLLRHPNSSPQNIFIDPKMHTITALPTWQHTLILPTFLAAGIPYLFQNHTEGQKHRTFNVPAIPDDFDDMSDHEKQEIEARNCQREFHSLYNQQTVLCDNYTHYHALTYKEDAQILIQHAFSRANGPWEGINTLLEYDVKELVKAWDKVATPIPESAKDGIIAQTAVTSLLPPGKLVYQKIDSKGKIPPSPTQLNGTIPRCPITIAEDELQRLDQVMDEEIRVYDCQWGDMMGYIGCEKDGWVELDRWEEAVEKEAELRKLMRKFAKEQGEEAQVEDWEKKSWWFDDFDEVA